MYKPGALILRIVVMKLIAPKIEDAPHKCKLNLAKSTESPDWAAALDEKGQPGTAILEGYMNAMRDAGAPVARNWDQE